MNKNAKHKRITEFVFMQKPLLLQVGCFTRFFLNPLSDRHLNTYQDSPIHCWPLVMVTELSMLYRKGVASHFLPLRGHFTL